MVMRNKIGIKAWIVLHVFVKLCTRIVLVLHRK